MTPEEIAELIRQQQLLEMQQRVLDKALDAENLMAGAYAPAMEAQMQAGAARRNLEGQIDQAQQDYPDQMVSYPPGQQSLPSAGFQPAPPMSQDASVYQSQGPQFTPHQMLAWSNDVAAGGINPGNDPDNYVLPGSTSTPLDPRALQSVQPTQGPTSEPQPGEAPPSMQLEIGDAALVPPRPRMQLDIGDAVLENSPSQPNGNGVRTPFVAEMLRRLGI
jgi:hypothetical protein